MTGVLILIINNSESNNRLHIIFDFEAFQTVLSCRLVVLSCLVSCRSRLILSLSSCQLCCCVACLMSAAKKQKLSVDGYAMQGKKPWNTDLAEWKKLAL